MTAGPTYSDSFYDEAYFLGTSGKRGAFSLVELNTKSYDRTNTVIEYFRLAESVPGKITEVGCGTAPFSRIVRQHKDLDHIEVIGTDVSQSGVNLLPPSERPPFKLAGAEKLPFEENSVIGVVEWDVLEHIPNPELAIVEAFRILRPGGLYHIVCPNPDSYLRGHTNPEQDPYRRDESHVFPPIVSIDFLDETLKNTGFQYEIFTRGFRNSEGQTQTGLDAMRSARLDSKGTSK